MPRKGSDRLITETPIEEPDSSPPDANGAPQAKPETKKEAVRLAMAAGVTMPKGIAQYAQDHFGMEIRPQYVSVLKGEMKKKEAAGGQKKKGNLEGSLALWPLLSSSRHLQRHDPPRLCQ
jgi:hypothetical protein